MAGTDNNHSLTAKFYAEFVARLSTCSVSTIKKAKVKLQFAVDSIAAGRRLCQSFGNIASLDGYSIDRRKELDNIVTFQDFTDELFFASVLFQSNSCNFALSKLSVSL